MSGHDRWTRALTTAGWLFTAAYLALVVATFRRAFAIRQSSFDDGVWGQRVEVMSVVSTHDSVIILVPAAAAAVAAALLSPGRVAVWSAQLVRVVAGLCYVIIAIAAVGGVGLFVRSPDSVGDLAALLGRAGGALMALAMIRVCLEAERAAGADRAQTPSSPRL